MEKNQYKLCVEVLSRLHAVGTLNDLVLIGSWCVPFYENYFSGIEYKKGIKTRDIDFLIPSPKNIKIKVDIPELLKDLGFVIGFKGQKGYIRLEHPQLVVEFLVPEKGKGLDKPYPLPQLGVNAVSLRFLTFLAESTIRAEVGHFSIVLPHPVHFALHKLIISERRLKEDKAAKDKSTAIDILKALIQKGEVLAVKKVFDSLPSRWQKKIVKGLGEEKEILTLLVGSTIENRM